MSRQSSQLNKTILQGRIETIGEFMDELRNMNLQTKNKSKKDLLRQMLTNLSYKKIKYELALNRGIVDEEIMIESQKLIQDIEQILQNLSDTILPSISEEKSYEPKNKSKRKNKKSKKKNKFHY